jgi:hypothetical protein
MTTPTQNQIDREVSALAKQHLGLETLESRRNGNLDYHELGVCNIKAALEAAYRAGMLATRT